MTDKNGSRRSLLIEAMVIVVSILLAFAIDAAWDVRADRADERVVLQGLSNDFASSAAEMDFVIERHRSRSAGFAYFQASTPAALNGLAADSASAVYRNLYSPNSFDAVRGTVDALIGAGDLELIRSRELRELVVRFASLDDDAREEAESMREAAIEFVDAVIPFGGPWHPGGLRADYSRLPEITGRDLAALRMDEAIVGMARASHHWSSIYLSELETLSEVIDETAALIDQLVGDSGS